MVLGFTVLRFDECKDNNKILQMQENDDNNSVLPLFFFGFSLLCSLAKRFISPFLPL